MFFYEKLLVLKINGILVLTVNYVKDKGRFLKLLLRKRIQKRNKHFILIKYLSSAKYRPILKFGQ